MTTSTRTTSTQPPFVTIRGAVAPTGISERQLRRWFHEGRLPHIRIGTRVLVDLPALLDMVHAEASKAVKPGK